ncbi:MAG: hypothetical protein NTX45_02135 [Proteobacteria bacterium]|nr:hypothetical protein [Pseudomonadota bacterium]
MLWVTWLFRFEHVAGPYFLDRWRGVTIKALGHERNEVYDLVKHKSIVIETPYPAVSDEPEHVNLFDELPCVNGKRGKHCDIP